MSFHFKELTVWQKSMDFAQRVIEIAENNTSDRKHFRLMEQLESSSASVAMNIAEGRGRKSNKEYVQFLHISRGSLYETITLLNLFERMGWITHKHLLELEGMGLEIGKMLNGLITSIRNRN